MDGKSVPKGKKKKIAWVRRTSKAERCGGPKMTQIKSKMKGEQSKGRKLGGVPTQEEERYRMNWATTTAKKARGGRKTIGKFKGGRRKKSSVSGEIENKWIVTQSPQVSKLGRTGSSKRRWRRKMTVSKP